MQSWTASLGVQVTVTSKKSSKDALKLKGLVHRLAPKMIQEQVAEYIRLLKEGMCIIICITSLLYAVFTVTSDVFMSQQVLIY